MDARRIVLMTGNGPKRQVYLFEILEDGTIVVPFHWSLIGKATGGILCQPDLTCATVSRSDLAGIARPSDLGLSYFGIYWFVLLVSLLSLQFPVRVHLTPTDIHPIELSELLENLVGAVRENPNFYTRWSPLEIEQRLSRAKTFNQIWEAFD